MWQDGLAMWSPVKMVNSSKLDESSMQARKPGHRASLRRHRTHTVVRFHQYDTLRPYARRLRGRVFKRSPVFFVVTPLSAKTICPAGNCSPMAFWSSVSIEGTAPPRAHFLCFLRCGPRWCYPGGQPERAPWMPFGRVQHMPCCTLWQRLLGRWWSLW